MHAELGADVHQAVGHVVAGIAAENELDVYKRQVVIRPPHTAAGSVLRNDCPRTMSGGAPSSIKRDQSCAARAPVTQLYTEGLFYPHERGNVVCILSLIHI